MAIFYHYDETYPHSRRFIHRSYTAPITDWNCHFPSTGKTVNSGGSKDSNYHKIIDLKKKKKIIIAFVKSLYFII